MKMSVNDPVFIKFLERLLQAEDSSFYIGVLEKLIDEGLDINEKVTIYQGVEEGEILENKTLLHIALVLSITQEVIYFLVEKSTPDLEIIALCARMEGDFNRDICNPAKFLEEMLKRYDGEVDYWTAHVYLELFLGFGHIDIFSLVYDLEFEIELFPIEIEMLVYITSGGPMDKIQVLKRYGSPIPSKERLMEAVNGRLDESVWERYDEIINCL